MEGPKELSTGDNLPKINFSDTSFDKIYAFYKNPDSAYLTPNQQKIQQKLAAAWCTMVSGENKTFTANMLQMSYGCSQAQSYRYVKKAEELFGNVLRANIAGQRAMLFEMAKQNHKEAKERKDFKIAAMYFKEMRELIGTEDLINFNPEKLENKPDKYIVPKVVQDAISEHFKTGVVDFNNLVIEDIDFEEIEHEEDI
jgi:hypothetical protein